MKHSIKAPFWQLALIALSAGCASGDPNALEAELDETVATTSEAVVSGWTSWSQSTQEDDGIVVGCHNGSLVTGMQKQGSKGRIYCTPVAGSNNTDYFWTDYASGSVAAACPSTHWVTGYISAAWSLGSGFKVRCSRTPAMTTGFCYAVPGTSTAASPATWLPAGYALKGGTCGATCSSLWYTACTHSP
jgi:hypothetical protein